MARIFNRSSNYLKFLTNKILFVSDELTLKNASVTSCYFKITKRHLNLLEHVSYSLLRKYGVPTPNFGVARSKEEAKKVFQEMKVSECVIKAQVLSGGRQLGAFKKGLKKGVHSAYSAEEVESLAGQMIGDYLVTKQTGSAGLICNTVMITERSYPKKEFYFAIMMDRSFNGPALIASAQGGTSIEAVAAATPEAIIMEPVDIIEGLSDAKAKGVCGKVGLTGTNADKTTEILTKLYKMFLATDALLLELNPYVEDVNGNFLALDAKFRFDDYSKFRQKDLFDLSDPTQENQVEASAAERGLNYIQLDGNIGCVVNGAGLAMATMDIIKLYKGDPANFLDVGGGATVDNIQFAISTILTDPKVQVILVNIFGGIMRCDVIAQGLVIAVTNMKLTIPLVCRLQGTKKKEAKIIISRSKLKILAIDDLDEAARLTTKLSAIIGLAKEAHIKVKVNTPIPS